MRKWYVIKTKVNQEKRALLNLSRQGFELFCPLTPILRKFKNTIKNILDPLFPSYIFVKLDLEKDNWSKINNTYGVKELLKNSSMYPGSVPSEFIENLKKVCDVNNCVNDSYFNYKIGQKVKFIEGPFLNKVVEIIKMPAKDRILVLQEFFSLKIKVLTSKEKIIPI